MATLVEKQIDPGDVRQCDHCGYFLSNEGVAVYFSVGEQEGVWCCFDCAIRADNPGTADEFRGFDKE